MDLAESLLTSLVTYFVIRLCAEKIVNRAVPFQYSELMFLQLHPRLSLMLM